MLLAPFFATGAETLILHAQLVLFMFLKWAITEWECGFTMLEYNLRGIKKEDCVMHSILNPFVNIAQYSYNEYIMILALVLGIISYYRFSAIKY
jgi:hypothetical protein